MKEKNSNYRYWQFLLKISDKNILIKITIKMERIMV